MSEEYIAFMRNHAEQAFAHFDKNKNGFIEPDEIVKTLKEAGKNPTQEDVDRMLAEDDLDKDGKISREEFIQSVLRNMPPEPPRAPPAEPAPKEAAPAE